nr:leucine-rich repeat domain-containing protein [Lachnospiraceae bacterium]
TDKKASKIVVPDVVTVNGITYKVVEIADKALKNNKKVSKVSIGKNTTKIGANAFAGCKKLKTVTVNSSVLKKIGRNAINGINKKATIKVPKKKISKYKKLFSKKTGYKKTMKIK